MKKILTIVVSVIMAISMTACGGNTDTTTQSSSEKSADIEGSSVETADKGITDMELYVDFTWFSYDWVGVILLKMSSLVHGLHQVTCRK